MTFVKMKYHLCHEERNAIRQKTEDRDRTNEKEERFFITFDINIRVDFYSTKRVCDI